MTIRNISGLKQDAREALRSCPSQQRIVLIHTAVLVGLSLLLTAADFVLSEMISGTGGLGNMGTRTILSTLQSMLPILQMLVLLGWNAGYTMAVMKIIRREPADHTTLYGGFSLFWALLRSMLLEGMIYFALVMLSFHLSTMIYMFTPWAMDLAAVMEPVLPSMLSSTTPVLDEALLVPALKAMAPLLLIFGGLYFLLALPVSYRLRMSLFCLVDAPRAGAMNALRTSRRIMRRNCFALFRLDLSYWWYHGLLALASLVQMIPMLDLPLPISWDALYYLCYGAYLAIVFVLYLLARNRVETTYAAAYETLREKPVEHAVVLGNIFDMQ